MPVQQPNFSQQPFANQQFANQQFMNQQFMGQQFPGMNGFGNPHPQQQMPPSYYTTNPQYDPYNNPQAYAQGGFNQQAQPFPPKPKDDGDMIDRLSAKSVANFKLLESLSDDVDLNEMYFAKPAAVRNMFNSKIPLDGKWFENGVYAIFNGQNVLVFTTPTVTLTVTDYAASIKYENLDEPLSEKQVTDGLIPVLTVIYDRYSEIESIKREAEVERLKEQARLKELLDTRDRKITEWTSARLFRTLDDTKLRTKSGGLSRNSPGELSKIMDFNSYDGLIDDKDILISITNALYSVDGECIIWNSETSEVDGIAYLDRGKAYSDDGITIICGDLKLEYKSQYNTLSTAFAYADLTESSLRDSISNLMTMIAELIGSN